MHKVGAFLAVRNPSSGQPWSRSFRHLIRSLLVSC